MTIDQAIKLQKELSGLLPEVGFNKYITSTKLGIEALKEAQRWRTGQPLHLPNLLPGETEE
jgi:hypothetical protein